MIDLKTFGFKPLLVNEGCLYASRGYELYRSTDYGVSFTKIAFYQRNLIERVVATIPLISRIMRKGFFHLEFDSFNNLIGVVDGEFIVKWESDDKFISLFRFPRGSRPLNVCNLHGKKFFWGEYFSNNSREEVAIYSTTYPYRSFKKEHIFPAGMIRHVHNVYFDKWNNNFVILTGDYGDECGIWRMEHNFKSYEPILRGDQNARAVSLCIEEDRIIGATDTQLEQNYLYIINNQGRQIFTKCIEGPCFHLTKVNSFYLATSVIEKSEVNRTNRVCLYGSLDAKNWVLIDSFVKDCFPKNLQKFFQFSVLSIVSSNDINNPYVFLYGMGLKKLSSSLLRIDSALLLMEIEKLSNRNSIGIN